MAVVAVVAVVAFTARVGVVLRGEGFHALAGYDQGVYYAAADAFVHGRLPYVGFLLLHPPGIVLLSPRSPRWGRSPPIPRGWRWPGSR